MNKNDELTEFDVCRTKVIEIGEFFYIVTLPIKQ